MNQFAKPANGAGAGSAEMIFGTYLMSLATIAAGILDLIWRDFDPSHQPFGGLGISPSRSRPLRLHRRNPLLIRPAISVVE